jgi:hypothetical protein
MLREQAGLCAICRRRPARHLCIDHCHATLIVRGLLCDACNRGLGSFGDDAARMRRAGDYIDGARGVRAARLHIVVPVTTALFVATLVPPLPLSKPAPDTLPAGDRGTAASRASRSSTPCWRTS